MIKDGKCTKCGTKPERRINRQPLTGIRENEFYIIEPIEMVDYAYYVCKCGMRYTPKEMGEAKETWEVK